MRDIGRVTGDSWQREAKEVGRLMRLAQSEKEDVNMQGRRLTFRDEATGNIYEAYVSSGTLRLRQIRNA